MQTMKVKPWGEGQGDHVVINVADFDAQVHEPLEPMAEAVSDEAPSQGSSEAQEAPARRGRKPKAE